MRFITEFKLDGNELKYVENAIKAHRESWAKEGLGDSIVINFGFKESGFMQDEPKPLMGIRYSLEIEAFPMDKWIEFKNRLFTECAMPEPNAVYILEMIKELESFKGQTTK
jgi:hypothetical protein